MRLTVSRRTVRRIGRGLLGLLFLAGSLVGLYYLGRAVTPPSATGALPAIYSPSVQRTEQYRRQVTDWLIALQALDREIVTLLTGNRLDMYAIATRAQTQLEAAEQLSQAISLTYPPASLTSLRDALQAAADQYWTAAVQLNRWVGEPTEASYLDILEMVRIGRTLRAQVEQNPWLTVAPASVAPALELPESPGPELDVPVTWGE